MNFIIHQVEDVTEFVRLKQARIEQSKLAEDLKLRAEKMEAEIYRRAQQIQLANEKLREAEAMKDRFLANMSHEIRTPMNAIIGFADLLSKTDLANRQQEFVSCIQEAGQNLLAIINDILDLSKIESGMVQFENVPFSIRSLIASVHSLLLNKAESKGIAFTTGFDPEITEFINGDPTRLTQILVNLVGNAIKFTEKGSVHLAVSKNERNEEFETVEFKVTDTGIGIAPDQLTDIFDRFTQGSSDTTRKYGGTGLGLSIAKDLIELQGGRFTVESVPGAGTSFTVVMRYRKTDAEQMNQFLITQTPGSRLEGRSILLVEDNKMNQRLAVEILAGFGMTTEVSENGKAAVEKLRNHHYDVVLMDIQMQEMDGYETTRIIRHELQLPVPVIAMTAHAFVGEKDRCLALGMNDYISKPFRTAELYRKIDAQVNKTASNGGTAAYADPLLVNFDYLQSTIGHKNPAFLSEMIELFVSDVPHEMKKMHAHVLSQNFKPAAGIAHHLYTSVSMLGIERLAETLRAIEEQCEGAPAPEILIHLCNQAQALLDNALTELDTKKTLRLAGQRI